MSAEPVLVTGAGGFIGGHLVGRLLEDGCTVRAVDIKPADEWLQRHPDAENVSADLREVESCIDAVQGIDEVYNLAADMGGMGFIESNKARCMASVVINTNLLRAATHDGVGRFFFASSACVYPQRLQKCKSFRPLRESDAYPADPEDGYGWEKLFGERMCRHFSEDFGLETRVARYHNVYGPHCVYEGGREKVVAATCRKLAVAELFGGETIDVWGDGKQVRSFTHIDDCLEGTLRITRGDATEPLNLGSDEAVTIDELVDLVEEIAGTNLRRRYLHDAPTGVSARSSDNGRIRQRLRWEPTIRLRAGLQELYPWIREAVKAEMASSMTAREGASASRKGTFDRAIRHAELSDSRATRQRF